ncbi:MAG: hypothetical protein LBJ26_16630 [Paenibacillus sp.]|nr:hypothetical protein [Paenibacillus sp.]
MHMQALPLVRSVFWYPDALALVFFSCGLLSTMYKAGINNLVLMVFRIHLY